MPEGKDRVYMGDDFRADLAIKIPHLTPGSLEPQVACPDQPDGPH
jgi:hypothetical protein